MLLLDAVVHLSELRASLASYRRRVLRGEFFQVEYYGNPIAVLKPYEGEEGEEISMGEFRDSLNDCWEKIDAGEVEAYILTYHGKPKAVFKGV